MRDQVFEKGIYSMINTVEYIKTPIGKWYSVFESEIEYFVMDTKKVLKNHIRKNDIVGLFMDLDSANLNSLVLYKAIIGCGATVIRCGITDIERQMMLLKNINMNVVICSRPALKYVYDKIKYKTSIVVDSLMNFKQKTNKYDLKIYEIFIIR